MSTLSVRKHLLEGELNLLIYLDFITEIKFTSSEEHALLLINKIYRKIKYYKKNDNLVCNFLLL
jgi:hypothetical protein